MKSRFLNFVVFIPIRWKCQLSVNFPGIEFLGTSLKFRWERKICRRLFTSSIEHEIRHFHIQVVQWWQRNVQKKSDTHENLLFCQSKPIAFWGSCCHRRLPCYSSQFENQKILGTRLNQSCAISSLRIILANFCNPHLFSLHSRRLK